MNIKYGLLIITLVAAHAHADLFKCKTPNGGMKFQDIPCPTTDQVLERKETRSSSTSYDQLNKKQATAYVAYVDCIDRAFYDGGYDVGDETRIALINKELKQAGLPEYQEKEFEALKEQVNKDNNLDKPLFMETYSSCIDRQPANEEDD